MNVKIKEHWQGVRIHSYIIIPQFLFLLDVLNDFEKKALAIMSLPKNIPLSLSELHALSDQILILSGDKSVDASWYTKRIAISAIYASAETFMTTTESSSDDFSATRAFVERRFEDSEAFGKAADGVVQCFSGLGATVVGVGRSWGIKV